MLTEALPSTRGDEGASSVEFAIVTPLFLLVVLGFVQFIFWFHANQAVALAAEEALDAAQVEDAGAGEGEAAAQTVLAQTGQVQNQKIAVDISGEVVTVAISAEPKYSVLPVGGMVSASATGQVERFIGEQDR